METKESMQNTIKTLQARSENIEKLLEKGNDVIVFQLGSHSIKFGFANQSSPQKIRTLLGYKLSKAKEAQTSKTEVTEQFENAILTVENILKKRGNLKLESKGYKGKPKPKIESNIRILEKDREEPNNEQPPNLKKLKIIEEDSSEAAQNKEKGAVSYNPQAIFEKEVFLVEQNCEYQISQPIKHGLFNISDKVTIDQVLNDMETLILYILNNKLGIPTKAFSNYSIILIIPDIFIRQQVKGLVNVFLRTLEFKYIYIHLESILACFGACLSQACVVDLGYEKVTISCVDEGLILPGTTIRKCFGGSDLDQAFVRILGRKHCVSSQKGFKLEGGLFGDLTQIEKLKEESMCFSFREEASNKHYECSVIRNGGKIGNLNYEKFFVGPNEACYIAPSLLYYTEAINILHKEKGNGKSNDYFNSNSKIFEWNDPEDNLDDGTQNYVSMLQNMQNYMVSNEKNRDLDQLSDSSKQTGSKIKLKISEKEAKLDETSSKNPGENPISNVNINNPFVMESLDELICYSISQIRESSMRKKMANSILLIGGTSQISKFVEELEDRMIETIAKYDSDIERVEVVDLGSKESNPENLSWVGGSILAKLDSIKNLWISRNRWLGLGEDEDEYDEDGEKKQKRERTQEVGIKYLKEKVPFSW